jgi:rod shape determining protein RodA
MHKFVLNRLELSFLIPAILIVALSLSAFYPIDTGLFRQQLIFFGVSLIAYFVFLNVDYKIFGFYSKYMYFFMIAILLSIFFIGTEARDAVRWIDIFGIRIQFSEIIKPFFIIFMASYLTSNDSRSLGKFLKAILLILPVFFLILKQPNLGNAMIYVFVSFFMLLLYRFPLRYFAGAGILVLTLAPLFLNMLAPYQKQRIMTFINPTSDPLSSSYNLIQSLISIGSGGLTGKGFGEATQSILEFLPETHTDFIFATISENLGFFGAMLLIGLYVYLLLKIYNLMAVVNDEFTRLIIAGLYFLFLVHIFLNIGMNLGIVPIVGITLPFASYGGSSLLTNFIILGILSSIKFDFSKDSSIVIR